MGDPKVVTEIAEDASQALQGLTWRRGLAAVGVMLAFFLVAKLAGHLIRRRVGRRIGWGGSVFALTKLLTYVLVFIGFVAGLSMLGVPLSSLVLASSALMVALGLSLQHVAQDVVAGIILLVEQPIRKNDFVTFGTTAGTVREIGLRTTHLLTPDGINLVVPNHLLVTTEVSNHSHPLPRARLAVEVPVSLLEEVDVVRATLASVAEGHPEVLREPPPKVRLEALLGSDFRFALIVWVADPPSTVRIACELRLAIAQAFARNGVRFPTAELLVHANHQRKDREQTFDDLPDQPGPPGT